MTPFLLSNLRGLNRVAVEELLNLLRSELALPCEVHMLDLAITALISEPSCRDPQPARHLLHGVVEVVLVVLVLCLLAILPWHLFLPVVTHVSGAASSGGRA
jgi:hypothetical protein